MQRVKYVYWEEDGAWIGYFQEYPDYWTQGETLDDLKDHLWDLYHDMQVSVFLTPILSRRRRYG